jgi:proline racemase
MKTKIRTLITICILAFVGVLNANATVNFGERNSGIGTGIMSFLLVNETEINGAVDYQKEAQMVTRWIADMAEAKARQKVIEKNEPLIGELSHTFYKDEVNEKNDEITDFRKEAQLLTKSIADREEANAIQKLVAEGKLVEN